jgi:hypothetical protein
MKIKIFIPTVVFFMLVLAYTCKSDENITPECNYDDPLNDIEWLNEKKQQLEMSMSMAGWQIIRYKYENEYVFLIDECFQCPDALTLVYNCDGNIICEFGGIDGRNTCPDFPGYASGTMLANGVQE